MSSAIRILRICAAVGGLFAAGGLASISMIGAGVAADDANAGLAGGPLVMRRLTETQYRNTIKDIFGDVSISGRFEPDTRDGMLIAVGASKATITPGGFEQYDNMAMGIAAQVVSPERRKEYMPCKPVSETAPDEACARDFLTKVGNFLYRRPLTEQEIADKLKIAATGTTQAKSFYFGLQLALARLLDSPQFLFVQEQAVPDPSRPGGLKLSPQSMATRLSLLIWGSSPDPELANAAVKGDLSSSDGLAKQVDRMLASPRAQTGARAYFADMLEFDMFGALSKDAALYPNYSADVGKQAQEQALRTIVDELVVRNGDYRDIFTTNRTYLTPMLASAYGVPFNGEWGDFQDWQPVTLPASLPQAGVLTQIGFDALHSSSGKTSPTLRGKAIRELFMCQEIPPPPPDVDFSKFANADGNKVSVRQAIEMHHSNPACAGCHNLMDPLGLALENYDTSGKFRLEDAHQPIDASGKLDNTVFKDAAGLGKALHDSPRTTSCLASRVYSYAVGRVATNNEQVWIRNTLQKDWAAAGYKYPALIRRIALDPGFYSVVMPKEVAPAAAAALQKPDPANAAAQPALKKVSVITR
jgi:hypothetical protein